MRQSNSTYKKGKLAEKQAEEYLINLGYIIVTKNYRFHRYEVDIIAYDMQSREYVFVEVKSLISEARISIFETVSNAKKRKIITTTLYWLKKNGKINCNYRIDFIGIVLDNVIHIKSAIY